MKSNITIEENSTYIILGILTLYLLIEGFFLYLLFLNRIVLTSFICLSLIFLIIYIPRFSIIKKIITKDNIKIVEDFLMINGVGTSFEEMLDFEVIEKKPVVIFFFNNRMIVFNQAKFCIRLQSKFERKICFNVYGSEKIRLLKEFLQNAICH